MLLFGSFSKQLSPTRIARSPYSFSLDRALVLGLGPSGRDFPNRAGNGLRRPQRAVIVRLARRRRRRSSRAVRSGGAQDRVGRFWAVPPCRARVARLLARARHVRPVGAQGCVAEGRPTALVPDGAERLAGGPIVRDVVGRLAGDGSGRPRRALVPARTRQRSAGSGAAVVAARALNRRDRGVGCGSRRAVVSGPARLLIGWRLCRVVAAFVGNRSTHSGRRTRTRWDACSARGLVGEGVGACWAQLYITLWFSNLWKIGAARTCRNERNDSNRKKNIGQD